jgi:hypothetical protein
VQASIFNPKLVMQTKKISYYLLLLSTVFGLVMCQKEQITTLEYQELTLLLYQDQIRRYISLFRIP